MARSTLEFKRFIFFSFYHLIVCVLLFDSWLPKVHTHTHAHTHIYKDECFILKVLTKVYALLVPYNGLLKCNLCYSRSQFKGKVHGKSKYIFSFLAPVLWFVNIHLFLCLYFDSYVDYFCANWYLVGEGMFDFVKCTRQGTLLGMLITQYEIVYINYILEINKQETIGN